MAKKKTPMVSPRRRAVPAAAAKPASEEALEMEVEVEVEVEAEIEDDPGPAVAKAKPKAASKTSKPATASRKKKKVTLSEDDEEVVEKINARASRQRGQRARKQIETQSYASMYNGHLALQRKKRKTGRNSLIGFGADTFQLGIPLPFMLQYILGCAVLPMGTVIEANGPQMSCKTMLMYEFARFFKDCGGWLDMIVTEGKISPSLIRSVVGWDKESRERVFSERVPTMNHMMKGLTDRITMLHNMATKGIDGKPKTGYKFPVLFGVDSIMGANALETSNKIKKEGDSTRSFPAEAMILTPYLKDVASWISGYPISVFLINHRKEKEKEDGKPWEKVKFTKPGGKQLRFQATYELVTHMVRQWQLPDPRPDGGAEIENRTIRIDNGKNSAGTDGREFDVRVSWRHRLMLKKRADGREVVTGRQITQWHWEEAIAPFLMSWKKGRVNSQGISKGAKERAIRLDSVLHLRELTKGSFYSETLGIPKSNPVKASVIGKRIEEDEEIIVGLRAIFGIDDGYVWDPSVDYRRVMDNLQQFASTVGSEALDAHADALAHDRFEDDHSYATGGGGDDDDDDDDCEIVEIDNSVEDDDAYG